MVQVPDQELNDDAVEMLKRADAGIMGNPTALGMIPYWSNVPQNPSASKEERAIADVVNSVHSIILSNKPEKLEWQNTELVLIKGDEDLVEAIARFKRQPGRDLSAGRRTDRADFGAAWPGR